MALSADTEVEYADNQIWEYPVAASARIYKGALVNIDMAGRALPATDASGVIFAGLAQAGADNSAGNDGDIKIKVLVKGRVRLNTEGMAESDLHKKVYVRDDNTFHLHPSTAESSPKALHNVFLGRLVEYVSPTEGWVSFHTPISSDVWE